MATQLGVFVRRSYGASPEALFRAFAEPDRLARWLSPGPDVAAEVMEYDFREGGRYRLEFRFPDGAVSTVFGVFRALAPPSRLVMTWTWEPPDPHAGVETLVTIRVEERDHGSEDDPAPRRSEVTVSHDRFSRFDDRDRHDESWRASLDCLAARLSEESPS